MKKIRQRKGMVAWVLAAALVLFLAGYFFKEGITHVGPGVWEFGGDKPGTDSQIGTDEFTAVISQAEYRQQCCVAGLMFFGLAAGILWEVSKKWKERNEL